MIFDDLNEKQKEAVMATEGKIRVVAGAGSGKTRVLTHRFAHLVENIGIDPANILCMTFTNKAAAEMRGRIAGLVGVANTNDLVCTIHGFCVKVLRRDIHRLGFPKSFTILDDDDAESIVKQVLTLHDMDRSKKTVRQLRRDIHKFKHMNASGYITGYMLPDSPKYLDPSGLTPAESFIHYQAMNYCLEFDDIIAFTLHLLTEFKEVRDYWQSTLNYVMVDEVQDCNDSDWEIMNLITGLFHNLFIVGDPDQAIYEWRGAKPSNLINWQPDIDIILSRNYRSTPDILDVANCVISKNKNRIPKDLFTNRPPENRAIFSHCKNEAEESKWIASRIRKLCNKDGDYSKCAILYRSSYCSRSIEQELMRKKIPYAIWGGIRFFERKEIKDALSYLRIVASDDDMALRRIINTPSRRFGETSLERLNQLAQEQGTSLYVALKHNVALWHGRQAFRHLEEFIRLIDDCRARKDSMAISETLNVLLRRSGLSEMYRTDENEERLENIEELISSIRLYEENHKDDDSVTLETYLQDISLYTNADYRADENCVRLMTIHQAKGLEFPCVFVCSLSEGVIPNHRALRERKIDALEEERRLMYVAITRAQDKLFLSDAEGYNFQTASERYPSRFLTEIEPSLLKIEGKLDSSLIEGSKALSREIDREIGIIIPQGLERGQKVMHTYLGEGTIQEISQDGRTARVRFGDGPASDRWLQTRILITLLS